MIIGFDGSRAFNPQRTGTENYSYQLLLNLAKIDSKNQYIVYLRPGTNRAKVWPKNFQFITIKMLRFWTQAGLATKTFTEKLDVLFIPAHTLPIIHKPSLKTVVTVHDLGAEYLPKMHLLKQRLYLRAITKFQLKSATKLIAVSKATKEDLVKRVGINPARVEVIYEGFDDNLFKKQTKADRLVNSLIPFFLFVGTVQPRKNLERVIKAFAIYSSLRDHEVTKQSSSEIKKIATGSSNPRNDGVRLIIAGSKGWLSDEIYALPKKLGIEEKVKFLGRVADKDLPALYSGAIALTFPSLFEGFGLPIIEAQACGCPVLTSNISSMPEVAGKGAILVDPYSVDDIVVGLKKMEDRALRMELIKKGLENIKRFSWEKCARETLKVLENI